MNFSADLPSRVTRHKFPGRLRSSEIGQSNSTWNGKLLRKILRDLSSLVPADGGPLLDQRSESPIRRRVAANRGTGSRPEILGRSSSEKPSPSCSAFLKSS